MVNGWRPGSAPPERPTGFGPPARPPARWLRTGRVSRERNDCVFDDGTDRSGEGCVSCDGAQRARSDRGKRGTAERGTGCGHGQGRRTSVCAARVPACFFSCPAGRPGEAGRAARPARARNVRLAVRCDDARMDVEWPQGPHTKNKSSSKTRLSLRLPVA